MVDEPMEATVKRPADRDRGPRRDGSVVVVVADSSASRRRLAAATLEDAGYRVLEASTGSEAIMCWRAASPDVVLLDVQIEGGAESIVSTVRRSRQREAQSAVITMSEGDAVEPLVQALAAGAQDHVRSPFDPAELVARVGASLRLVNERERLRRRNEELEYLGATDELTGLATRRHIEDELFRLGAAAARYHQPLAAVLFSIDGWPEIEAAGGGVADCVVQEVAVLISAIGRTGDLAGRYSDHEYLVVLPMTSADGAQVYAERARAVVAAAPVATDMGPVEVSMSAGCATGAPGPRELLDRALDAVSRAKAAGGDTLVSISF